MLEVSQLQAAALLLQKEIDRVLCYALLSAVSELLLSVDYQYAE